MGLCHGKPRPTIDGDLNGGGSVAGAAVVVVGAGGGGVGGVGKGVALPSPARNGEERPEEISKPSPFPFYTPSPARLFNKNSSSANSTPRRFFKRPFPPPSPAKHIRAALARRHGSVKPNEVAIPEGCEAEYGLDKSFAFSKHFASKYELGDEIGRGHFGYTCTARFKKGELRGQQVAVKIIPKAKMTTAIAIEDVRREVKILRALTGHSNLVQFYDAYEDHDNVYIVMELCEGGELLDRILARGGKYSEDDAKAVMVQILNVVAFCHLQGVVHRDLKPEALSKTLTVDEVYYLREQFTLLEPNKNGCISLDNIRMALTKHATEAMKESRILEFVNSMSALQYRKMDFEEFCAAAISVHQLEGLDRWEQHARSAYELFEKDGNRALVIEELATELGLAPAAPVHTVLHDWIRQADGKLSFLGFVKLLHGVSSRSFAKA